MFLKCFVLLLQSPCYLRNSGITVMQANEGLKSLSSAHFILYKQYNLKKWIHFKKSFLQRQSWDKNRRFHRPSSNTSHDCNKARRSNRIITHWCACVTGYKKVVLLISADGGKKELWKKNDSPGEGKHVSVKTTARGCVSHYSGEDKLRRKTKVNWKRLKQISK